MILKIKFNGDAERIKEYLEEGGYKSFSKSVNGDFWADGVPDKKLPEFGRVISEASKKIKIDARYYNVELEEEFDLDGEPIEYVYDDIKKKIFIASKSAIWLTDSTMDDAIRRMHEIDLVEQRMGGSLLDFDNDQVVEAIREFWIDANGYIALTRKARLAYGLAKMFEADSLKAWKSYSSQSNLYSLVGNENIKETITKENFLKFFQLYDNPQVSIIPLLLFEGVIMSIKSEDDEFSPLLKNHIVDNGIYMEKRDTIIELDEETLRAVKITAKQRVYRGVVKRNVMDPLLLDTPYILRPIEGTRAKGQLGYSGLRLRFSYARDSFRYMFGADDFTPTTIRNLGKLYYMDKYLKDGLTFKHAIVKTLQRYNEYEFYLPESGKSHETVRLNNTTREFRLKRLWEIYYADKNNDTNDTNDNDKGR